ncbi:MAG TPA: DUF2330 domain-containing protein [Candidatus Norongarragalinales archaeon]|nr:DUF2330 domain-containing protein [Candidatus Norongarragalinales archaeon]
MNKIFFFAAVCFLFLAANASADGGIVPVSPYAGVFAPEQKAAIFWDGTTERIILSTKITSNDSMGMAWVIPIQSDSQPEVKPSDSSILFKLGNLFGERIVYDRPSGGFGAGAAGAANGVEVLQTLQADVYNLTILKATDAESLVEWLDGNGFSFPENKKSVLEYYVGKNYYFIANKIDLLGKFPGASADENETACASGISIFTSASRYYGLNASEAEDDVRWQIEQQFNDTEGCMNSSFNVVQALVELREGIATPLEISFTPEKPFYPMKISSINDGYTTADVYIFGEECFNDSSQLLEFQSAKQDSALAREYGFDNAKCVTMLQYSGQAEGLTQDSFFTEKPFSEEDDSDYVPPQGFVDMIAGTIPFILLMVLALVPAFAIGALAEYFAGKNGKKARIIRALGIFLLLGIVLIPVLWLLQYAPEVNALILFGGIYAAVQAGFFLAGRFAARKKKLRVALALAAAAAVIAVLFFSS